ncbi:hypothetical protein BD626DRAFT_508011 [Schizophyllum amplum]|uniref:Uncharacterized protein n=1 Tax=Schizophyllum amplum TaxID=97359 RepID=A0A550C3N7_9AGAR|nr:hypothetical protein BD626DRAFT_508011 [Auriculariopsis ampla]
MRRHSQSTKSPTPNSRRSSFATPASHSGTSSFIHTPSTSFTKIAPHTFTTLSAPAPPAVPPSVYPVPRHRLSFAPLQLPPVRLPLRAASPSPSTSCSAGCHRSSVVPQCPTSVRSSPALAQSQPYHCTSAKSDALESIPPPPQPPALLSALASTSSSGGLDVNAWDDKIQRISDYLRASAAFDKLNSDTTTARKYPTTATSDPRIVAREKRKIELSEERKNALAAVVAQPTWLWTLAKNQRAQTLDKLTTFAKAVNDLYDAMVTVHARHKKQQEEELAAKAEEEASRKRPREEEEAAPDPEDELAEKVAALELDMRALADDFEEQYDAIDEQVATEVRNILTAIEGAKPIDVDAPAAPALAPEDRLKQHIQQAGTLGTDIQDILQTFQRKEIAALREEVDAFNKEAPDIQQEIDDLAKQQTALERHLAALTIGLDAHVDRHPPTPPQSPILAPTPMLELPAKDGAPSLEHAIKEEVRARLRPILQAARQEIGEAYIAQGGEVVRTVVPHLTKVNRVLETLAKRESVAVRREPNVGFTLGPWGHPPA